jgi:hypothetical protein
MAAVVQDTAGHLQNCFSGIRNGNLSFKEFDNVVILKNRAKIFRFLLEKMHK